MRAQRLQGQLGAVRQYNGAVDAFQKIVSKEGVRALWKGLSPALVRQSTYGSLRYGLYTPIKKVLVPDGKKETMFTKITAGAVAGAVASAIANPTGSGIRGLSRLCCVLAYVPASLFALVADLVKVRMQVAPRFGVLRLPVQTVAAVSWCCVWRYAGGWHGCRRVSEAKIPRFHPRSAGHCENGRVCGVVQGRRSQQRAGNGVSRHGAVHI
jgi:hypothetical protein